ncbi:MAG TPA: twin-arginine translocase TatA/TatE family subunit [Gammaproteobacteria bacterium]|nr:twin-arginine translocase TatA/TatE family subunit [Gammaproteobacteria bacterium]
MGISPWQLLIILAIVLVLFGAKRLRSVGSDVGAAIKGFRTAMREDDEPEKTESIERKESEEGRVIEGESRREKSNS